METLNSNWPIGFPRQRSCWMRPGPGGPGPIEKDAGSPCAHPAAPAIRTASLNTQLPLVPHCAQSLLGSRLLRAGRSGLGAASCPWRLGEGACPPHATSRLRRLGCLPLLSLLGVLGELQPSVVAFLHPDGTQVSSLLYFLCQRPL